MSRAEIKTTLAEFVILLLIALYATTLFAALTFNLKFSLSIGLLTILAPLWNDIRTLTAGRKTLFLTVAQKKDE